MPMRPEPDSLSTVGGVKMRVVKPYWKKSHGCYYVNLNGKPTRLDPVEERAMKMYRKLLSQADEEVAVAELASPMATVHDLLAEFLAWTEIHREARTLESYQRYLVGKGSFAAFVGSKLLVNDVRAFHVTRWLDKRYPKASTTTIAAAITAVKRAFLWAVKEGYIKSSPVSALTKPTRKSRGEEAYLMPEQWAKIEKNAKPGAFLDLITVMKETGCRPQEIKRVEARHFDRKNRCWDFPKEESKGKKRRRIVHLQDNAFAICERLAEKYPDGPIFRNEDGKPWTNYALNCRCARLTKKIGFRVFPYAIRHTFATQSIINGVDVVTIATLMGHKDLKMLMEIYQHIHKNLPHLKEGLRKAIGA